MRSVHTLASVHSHFWATSLPCLAFGTHGRLICSCVSFTLPPSCPPWLHGRYPFHRYYGDSDSCSAPSSTRAGLLDSRIRTCGHSVSSHPMRPRLPAILRVPGGLGPRFAFLGYRRFFGLRSLLAVSSVASGRIEFVSPRSIAPQFYGLSVRFQLLSTPCRHGRSYFQLPGGKLRQGGILTLCARSLSSALTPPFMGVSRPMRWRVTASAVFPTDL